MTKEEFDSVYNDVLDRLDTRFVHTETCNDIQKENNQRWEKNTERLGIVEAKFGIIEKLLWAIATTGVGILLTSIFNLILK